MVYDIEKLPDAIEIGRQGESNVFFIELNLEEWLSKWPSGIPVITFMAPKTKTASLVIGWFLTGTILSIPVARLMTQEAGTGSINIRLIDKGNIEKRSAVCRVYVSKTHPSANSTPPDPVADWLNVASPALDEVLRASDEALAAATAANNNKIIGVAFLYDDIIFTREDGTTIKLANAKNILRGPQGPTGLTGSQGAPGQVGPKGDRGPIGLTGETGAQGAPGVPGEKGADGASAYDGAVIRGYTRTAEQFYADLASLEQLADALDAL